MRTSHFIFCCLLFTVFHLLSAEGSHSLSQLLASERRPARKFLVTSFSNPESQNHKAKVHEEELNGPFMGEIASNAFEYEAINENSGDLVYHTDYHGVTTHPNPTPKHP